MKTFKKITALIMCAGLLCSCEASAQTQKMTSASDTLEQIRDKIDVSETIIETAASTEENKEEISAELSDVPDNVCDETTEPYIEDIDTFQINTDLISELGMTYLQLCEKYDDSPEASFNTCGFENGYGRYCWKSFEGKVFENIEEAGGCNIIDGLNTYKLLRTNEPLTFDELVNNYGFVLVSSSDESEMDFRFWSEFSNPEYNGIYFSFATTEKGVINNSTSISIGLNKDCLEAGK